MVKVEVSQLSNFFMEETLADQNSNNEYCLGFKDGKPVLAPHDTKKLSEKPPEKKKTVLIKVDRASGDKYIDVNGKRIKIVPQKTVPIELKKNLSNLVTSHDRNHAANVSKPINAKRDNLKIVVQKEIRQTDKVKHAVAPSPVVRGDSRKTMEVLNKCDNKGMQTDNIKVTDKYCQTDSSYSVDFCCQTNLVDLVDFSQDEDFFRVMNLDPNPCPRVILNNVNFGVGPVIPSTLPPQPSHVVQNATFAAAMAKKRFFDDLQQAVMPNAAGNLPIHEAVIKDDMVALKRNVIVLKARNESVNLENHNHNTPLQLSIIHYSRLEMVKYLLENGANLLDCDDEGNNLIHLAVEYNRTDSLEALLNFAIKNNISVDRYNFEGQTSLIIACISGLHECAHLLIKFGANVNLKDKKSGRTALFHAAEKHDVDMVQLLLENKADPKIKNFFGTSPHDAMYEIDEIPMVIKSLIFKKNKRKINEMLEQNSKAQAMGPQPKKMLKTYPKLKKIDTNELSYTKAMGNQPIK